MLFYGINPTFEVLKSKHRDNIKEIIVQQDLKSDKVSKIVEIAQGLKIKVRFVNRNVLDSILKTSKHQGIGFDLAEFRYADLEDVIKREQNIILPDSITDPNNLGAIARSALLFGFYSIVITKDRSVDITYSVAKSSSGAIFHVNIVKVVNLARTIDLLKEEGYFIVGLDARGNVDISDLKVVDKIGLVVGSEGDGMRRLVKEKCDTIAFIKTTGKIDSLNVSNASAIAMYEIFKKNF
ncbi:MAG: 23S rRNA (guanosine(2251)-2'-O)-methyltransferase RlmB [Brevinematia bacterium]